MSSSQAQGHTPRRTHIGQMGDHHHHDTDRGRMDSEGPVPVRRQQQQGSMADSHSRCSNVVHGDEGPVHE